ncbi:MAG: hypothetical protein ACRCZF_14100, partial [Gemmataceae bacterium]
CQVLTRFANPFGRPDKRTLGVRCMKMPTIDSPVKLRLVGVDGSPHARGSLVQVTGTDTDFTAKPAGTDGFEFRDGLYKSGRTFANIACVQIALGAGQPQYFPIAVVSDDPVTIKFAIRPEDEKRAAFERTCNDLRARVADVNTGQIALFKEISRLIDLYQNKEALGRAETSFKATEISEKALIEELRVLREEPEAQQTNAKQILEQTDERLKLIHKMQESLGKRVTDLKEAVKKSADPVRVAKEYHEKELANRVKELVARGDIPEALDTYDQIITLQPQNAEIKDLREKLQNEWAPKDEEHRKARAVLKQWTDCRTPTDFKEAMPVLRTSTDTMLKKQDKLGLRRTLNLFEPAYTTLKILLDTTDTRTEDGENLAKEIQRLTDAARQVEVDTREYLKRLMPESK